MNVTSITSATAPSATAIAPAEQLTPSQRARAAQLAPGALRNASPAEQRAAVAAQFEAILLRQMLSKTMTSMMGKEAGAASTVYGDLLTETVAQKLAAGPGMGLSRILEQQLAPRLNNNSTASSSQS